MLKKKITRLSLLVVLLAGVWFFGGGWFGEGGDDEQGSAESKQEGVIGGGVQSSRGAAKERISSMPRILEGCVDAVSAKAALEELHGYLQGLPPELAAAVVAEVLRGGVVDAPTGVDFDVGGGGRLDGHPSLRVAFLDWLLEFDAELAGIVSRELLETPTQADEWALALRNCARAEAGEDHFPFLREKTEALIRNADWNVNPSIGFFESFDVLVHIHATESAPLLSELVSDRTPEGKALAHAAFLTLDRLTLLEPVGMMKRLSGDQELTKARGAMVANMMARADLRDVAQREVLQSYLLDPSRSAEELRAFAGVFPNANFSISKNLLTTTETPSGDELRAHDAAALLVVDSWAEDPAFEKIRPHILAMQRRLGEFVR